MPNIANIPAGKDIPNDFNVIIEIPANSGPVKYEFDKESGMIVVDRFMPTAMQYPCNYGFIPNTLADDGDPADVLLLTPFDVVPGAMVRARPLGLLKMTDESGGDNKILAVPVEKVCQQYAHMKSLDDVPQSFLDTVRHFFESYKGLEPNKWVKVDGWEGIDAARMEIQKSVTAHK